MEDLSSLYRDVMRQLYVNFCVLETNEALLFNTILPTEMYTFVKLASNIVTSASNIKRIPLNN